MGKIKKCIKKFCYASSDKVIFETYQKKISSANYKIMTVASRSGIAILSILFVLSLIYPLLSHNMWLYMITDLVLIGIYLGASFWLTETSKHTLTVLYLIIFTVYLFAMILGTFCAINTNATTVCVLITMMPIFILDYPVRVLIFNLCSYLVFCMMAIYSVDPQYAITDIVNTALFLICTIPISYYASKIRLENIMNEERLFHQTEIDYLTGTYNRKAFVDYMRKYLEKSPESALIMIDVDNFKQINDTYGHLKGDEILCALAETLKESVSQIGITARYGGDEFIVFLPCITERKSIECLVEKMTENLESKMNQLYPEIKVTVSMGITINSDQNNDTDTICQQADCAMYQIKQNRKNGYAFYMN